MHEAFLLLGMLVNEAVARALKYIFKHPRPATCHMLRLCHSYGMPSSHTAMAFFFFMATALAALSRSGKQSVFLRIWGICEAGATLALATAVALSRVYLGYHSILQVIAGAGLGMAVAAFWHVLLVLLHPRLCWFCRLPMFTLLAVRDTWNVPDPLEVERQAFLARKEQ